MYFSLVSLFSCLSQHHRWFFVSFVFWSFDLFLLFLCPCSTYMHHRCLLLFVFVFFAHSSLSLVFFLGLNLFSRFLALVLHSPIVACHLHRTNLPLCFCLRIFQLSFQYFPCLSLFLIFLACFPALAQQRDCFHLEFESLRRHWLLSWHWKFSLLRSPFVSNQSRNHCWLANKNNSYFSIHELFLLSPQLPFLSLLKGLSFCCLKKKQEL